MLNRRRVVRVGNYGLMTGLILAGFVACKGQGESMDITSEEEQLVASIADPVAGELLRTLVARLTDAMAEGGPVNAIEFCSREALPLTRSVQSRVSGNLELKRTSFRVRNPANAPDEAEEEALLFFERAIQSGEASPSTYIQRVSEEEFRYYRALYLGEVCLQCHGSRDSMAPEVLDALGERYPEDLATGYEAGDFRGVVRVSVPTAELSAALPEGQGG
jgi:hypothetical protein